MNMEDLRVQRTRKLLKAALIQLIIAKGYEHVTIREVTKEAQIGYKTFFRHYESIEALTQEISLEVLTDLQKNLLPPEDPNAPEHNTLALLTHADAHRDLFRAILKSPVATQMIKPFIQFGMQEGISTFGGSDIPDDLVAYHFASSMIAFVQWWLENDQSHPTEEMVEYIRRLLLEPIRNH